MHHQHTTEERRRRWRFFLEHAGYATPPGRAACALELADAEELLETALELGAARFELEDDPEPYEPGDVDTPEQVARYFESGRWTGPFGAILTIGDDPGTPAGRAPNAAPWSASSLGGIVVGPAGADDPYIRTVRAELASELRDELAGAIVRAQVRELADELAERVGAARARDELRGVLDTIEQEAGR